jgi:hypothetical protein
MDDPVCKEIEGLDAVLYPAGVPSSELDALPGLYGNVASTAPFFRLYDYLDVPAACVLHRPHHVFVFRKDGRTVEVLNRTCAVPPEDVERACAAIFRGLPDTRRIHMDVTCSPAELALPVRFLFRRDYRAIEIPGGPEEYTASLGKHTRRNLRSYERRWSRDHPGSDIRVVSCEGRAEELFEQFRVWKRARFAGRGTPSHWDEVRNAGEHYTALLEEGGEALVVSIDGEPVGTSFFFHVGSTIESQEAAYDTRFEPYALGTLMHYWTALEAARRGCTRVSLGPGPNAYFERFGSTLRPSYRISVFRSELARLDSLNEAAETGRRRLRLGARSTYWKSRHTAGTVLRKFRRSPDKC